MRRLLLIATIAVLGGLVDSASGVGKGASHSANKHATTTVSDATTTVSVFASGFNNPRGLTFGPHGNLYVAEGGLGGSHSTVGQCQQVSGAAAPYTGSTDSPTLGGRISRVSPAGVVSTVVDALPSSQTSPAVGSLVSGASSVAFVHHRLYALLSGAGCSHGVPNVPNGVIRVGQDGAWRMIANLSAFQAAHPVAHPDPADFEPDGTWFSMASFGGALYPMDSNHGELDRVTPSGQISRVVDISAQLGHVVPTALTHHGSWYIGNLGEFGASDGTVPNEHVYRLGAGNALSVVASDLEQVVGLAFRGGNLYALELSTTPGGPTPGTGAIVRVRADGPPETIYSGLVFPTGMTIGPDGAFYVSERGFGFGAGEGRVLRIATH